MLANQRDYPAARRGLIPSSPAPLVSSIEGLGDAVPGIILPSLNIATDAAAAMAGRYTPTKEACLLV